MPCLASTRVAVGGALLLVTGIQLVLVGCSLGWSQARPASSAGWVLAEVPKDAAPDTYPAVAKVRYGQTFTTYAECDNVRVTAIQDAAAIGSDTLLSAESTLRCIPATPPTATKPAK